MTDLTGKFGQLETLITTKFDAVILRLDNIHTALTSASGSIEAAPIVAAIEAMRGNGPENTIRSLNQSVWNIAGVAPGKSISDLHTLLTTQHAAIGVYLAAIGADTDATATALGVPTGDATTTLLGMIYSVQYALTHYGATDTNLLSVLRAVNKAIGGIPDDSLTLTSVRGLIAQQTEATGRLLDPISYPPVDVCENAYVSSGYVYYQNGVEIFPGFSLGYPGSIASWPQPPTGFGITRVQDLSGVWLKLNTGDWTDYRIYVSSTAATFGVTGTSAQRLSTNQWLNLALNAGIFGNDMLFIVDGSSALKVYICPAATLVGGTAPTGVDFTSSSSTSVLNGRRYLVWPDLEGITEGAGGVELTPAATWSGYEVYIQTSAPAATLHDITDPAQDITGFVVNQWNTLGNNHTMAFSVDAAYLAKGYMRVPVVAEYVQLLGIAVGGYYRLPWPSDWVTLPDAQYVLRLSANQALDIYGGHSQGQAVVVDDGGFSANIPRDGSILTVTGPKTGIMAQRDYSIGLYAAYARIRNI